MRIYSSLDGWYAVASDDFTYASVARFTRSFADSLRCRQSDGRRQVVLGYDRRFGSERFAGVAAAELARAGIDVAVSACPVPAPAVVGALLAMKADGGMLIGGAHLPAAYNGIEIWNDDGARVLAPTMFSPFSPPESARTVRPLRLSLTGDDIGGVASTDLMSPYIERLSHLIGLERLRSAGLTFIVDVMHGATAGLVSALFTGDATEGVELNHLHNPLFPGIGAPDPVEPNLSRLQRIVIDGEAMLGLGIDGSGERLGVVDEQGRLVDARLISLLLVRMTYESRRGRGPLIKSAAATSGIDRMTAQFGVKLVEVAPGWPSLSETVSREHASLAIDGEGGYAIGEHLPDRDGLAAGLLLVDYCLHKQRPLSALVSELEPFIGGGVYLRRTVPLAQPDPNTVTELLQRLVPPVTISGNTFNSGRTLGGERDPSGVPMARKLVNDDGSWLLLQPDVGGCQLLLAAEATSLERAEALMEVGRAIGASS